jgi:hypothetical protein
MRRVLALVIAVALSCGVACSSSAHGGGASATDRPLKPGEFKVGDFIVKDVTGKRDDVEQLASFRLDQACADQAVKFWARVGFDKQEAHVIRSYTTHMNRSEQRCLIDVHEFMTLKETGVVNTQTVFDATEGVEIAHAIRDRDGYRIAKGNDSEIMATPALGAWFDGLMTQ